MRGESAGTVVPGLRLCAACGHCESRPGRQAHLRLKSNSPRRTRLASTSLDSKSTTWIAGRRLSNERLLPGQNDSAFPTDRRSLWDSLAVEALCLYPLPYSALACYVPRRDRDLVPWLSATSGATARLMRRDVVRVAGWIVASLLLLGADWQNCQSDLDKLRGRASEASDRASGTRSASSALERKQREVNDCRSTDPKGDGCRTLADEYDVARKHFQAAKRSLDGTLDDVDSSIRAVNSSCDYSFSSVGTSSSTSDPLCWLLQRSKGHVSAERLMETCKKVGKSDEQCRACLQ